MSNNNNFVVNSQPFNNDPEQKKIRDTFYRCTESELLLLLYAKKLERGIDARQAQEYLRCSDSTAYSNLCRLSDIEDEKGRLLTPLMKRDKCGPHGSVLYFVKEEVNLEQIEKVCQEKKYNYENLIKRQNKRLSKQGDVTYQEENDKTSTDVPVDEPQINNSGKEKSQTQKVESVVSENNSVKNQETDELALWKKKLAEKDKQIEDKDKQIKQLKDANDQSERYIRVLLDQKAV